MIKRGKQERPREEALEHLARVPEVAASRTRRTYAKSNSSTYVTVAETAGASCIFSVFVAEWRGSGNSLYSTTRGICASARRRRRRTYENWRAGAYSLGSRATGEEGASPRLASPRVPAAFFLAASHLSDLMPARDAIRASLTRISGSGFLFEEYAGGDVTLQ